MQTEAQTTPLSLESLGISQEVLIERLVDRIAGNVLSEIQYDEDDGEWRGQSQFAKRLNDMVRQRLDKVVVDLGEKFVLPKVAEMVEGLVLQETNRWGEKTGKPVTFTEYLVQRAEAFMVEEVNYEGKTRNENNGFSWSKSGTRVAFMVHKHLHFEIERAMKDAMANANASIAKGLNEAVRIQINEVASKLKTTVSVK